MEPPTDEWMLGKIKSVFEQGIRSAETIDNAENTRVVEINEEWMFRFPRNETIKGALGRERRFLTRFAPLSPLPIPLPAYNGEDFIGYRKIAGRPLTRDLVESLSSDVRTTVARQIDGFLSALHSFPLDEARRLGSVKFEERVETIARAAPLFEASQSLEQGRLDGLQAKVDVIENMFGWTTSIRNDSSPTSLPRSPSPRSSCSISDQSAEGRRRTRARDGRHSGRS